jgi:hypothetical protein
MMKATVINGCAEHDGFSEAAVTACMESLKRGHIESDRFNLCDIQPKPCMGCDSCQIRNPGICAINDGVGEILRHYLKNDIAVILAPILFGSFNSTTKNFIDRAEPLCVPYQIIHNKKPIMKPRYEKYPNLLVVGISQDLQAGYPDIFRQSVSNSILAHLSERSTVEIIETEKDSDKFSVWLNSIVPKKE